MDVPSPAMRRVLRQTRLYGHLRARDGSCFIGAATSLCAASKWRKRRMLTDARPARTHSGLGIRPLPPHFVQRKKSRRAASDLTRVRRPTEIQLSVMLRGSVVEEFYKGFA